MTHGKLTVIVGLPGSGKSRLINEMRPGVTGLCIHDFHANALGDSPLVENSKHYCALIEPFGQVTAASSPTLHFAIHYGVIACTTALMSKFRLWYGSGVTLRTPPTNADAILKDEIALRMRSRMT
jgi:hypothetical protein